MGVRDDKDLEASEMIEQQGKEVGWDGQQLHDTFKIQSKYIHFARETDSIRWKTSKQMVNFNKNEDGPPKSLTSKTDDDPKI